MSAEPHPQDRTSQRRQFPPAHAVDLPHDVFVVQSQQLLSVLVTLPHDSAEVTKTCS